MRMVFGLAGLLITIGIIVWIMGKVILPYQATVIHEGRNAQRSVSQIGGTDFDTGIKASESITMSPQDSGGKNASILVTSLLAGGPMEKYFGLKRNDSIVEVSSHGSMQKVSDWNDSELAMALVLEAYQTKNPIVVVRNGMRLELPMPTVTANVPVPAAPANTGTGGGQANTSLQNQLNQVQGIPTH